VFRFIIGLKRIRSNNFIKAVRNRDGAVVPFEIGHSSCTLCNIGSSAYELDSDIKWDTKAQSFGNDEAALQLL